MAVWTIYIQIPLETLRPKSSSLDTISQYAVYHPGTVTDIRSLLGRISLPQASREKNATAIATAPKRRKNLLSVMEDCVKNLVQQIMILSRRNTGR